MDPYLRASLNIETDILRSELRSTYSIPVEYRAALLTNNYRCSGFGYPNYPFYGPTYPLYGYGPIYPGIGIGNYPSWGYRYRYY